MARWFGRGSRTLIVSVALCAAVGPASAHALPSSTPQQAAVTNGTVFSVARGGGLTYIGGRFDELSVPQNGFGQVDAVNGRYTGMPSVSHTNPGLFGPGQVSAVAPDGAGGYYIGGTFDRVGGVARQNLAHVLPDGTVDPGFNAGVINNSVGSLLVSDGVLYVGGSFTEIGGLDRERLAKLSPTSGDAFSAFDAGPITSTVTEIEVSGTSLFIAGFFLLVDGQSRRSIAKLSAANGDLITGFNANVQSGTVNAIEVDASGNLYAGGDFQNFGNPDTITIGGQSRNRIAKLSGTSGNAFSAWNPDPNGLVSALELSGSELFVAGSFNTGPDDGTPEVSIGGQPRNHLAKLSATSGNAFTGFDIGKMGPQPSSVVQIFDLWVSGGALFVGGNFGSVNEVTRTNAAKFSTSSGGLFSAFNPNAEPASAASLGTVFAIAPFGSQVALGGTFGKLNRVVRKNIAALDDNGAPTDFNPDADETVIRLALFGTSLYASGDFTKIGGQDRSGLAKLSTASGNAFSAWNPNPNGTPFALAVTDTAVYAGGAFTQIGTLNRNGLAKLSHTSGNAFSAFNPDAEDFVTALAVDGTGLYVGGDFDDDGIPGTVSIGGQSRNHIAKLSLTSGNAFSAWNPNANGPVRALAVSGSALYVGGDFSAEGIDGPNIGGQRRESLAKLSTTSGNAFSTWAPQPNDTVRSIAVDATAVYVGGDFSGVNSIGGQSRNKLAALSPTSGNAFSAFDPNMGTEVADEVQALAVDGGHLFAGGDFPTVGGVAQPNYAQFAP